MTTRLIVTASLIYCTQAFRSRLNLDKLLGRSFDIGSGVQPNPADDGRQINIERGSIYSLYNKIIVPTSESGLCRDWSLVLKYTC